LKKQQAAGRFKSDCLLTWREKEVVNAPLLKNANHMPNTELKFITPKFHRLLPGRKRLIDTVRMIAYRGETAMAGLLLGPR